IPSFEPPTISAPVSPTAAPSRTTSSTTVLSAPSSPTTILSRLTLSTSPPSIPTSTKIASSAPTSPIQKLKCELACCTSEYPFVPEDQSDLESTGRKRICQLGWFTKFKWLSYCKSKKKVYCYFCRYAYFGGFHPEINKIGETSLTFAGYEDWKNALARFVKHESGKIHSDCVYLVKQQQKPTVAARLSLAHEKQQAERRKMFLVQVERVKYLSRQGLAIRGHVENEGNVIQLLKLREADVHGLDSWVEDGNYLSHDIINEICQIISLTIIHEIIKEISERKFYSLICDATSDESDIEQLCFTIRSVDKDFIVHEDVLGLYAITSETAEHITGVILDILIRCTLNLKYCRGQAYDGAPATAGHISGVSTRIKSLCSKAFFVHCNAHSLDLVLQDLSRGSFAISDALDMTKDIVNFIKESPKRLNLLDVISGSDHYYKLKPLCPTRWTVRASSMNLLIINYSLVKTTLGAISEEGGRPAAKANGWQEKMEKFSSYFGLKLAHLIFSATETVSCSLQRVDNNVQDILCAIDTLINYLTRIKTDDYFKTFYEGIRDDAKSLTDEPILLRIRKPPSRFDFLSSATHYETVYQSYRHQYFDIINKILNFLDLRFNQSVFPLLCKVEKLLLLAANGMKDDDIICLNDINEFLIDDINVERLQHELPMLSDYFSRINNEKNLGIKQITKISTICQLLNTYQVGKTMFHEYNKLLLLYLTIPMTTATAERSFSALNRIKTYLLCTMTQRRLNHVIIPHIHKEKLDQLDLNKICSDFMSKNESRKAFFGHE
ncbi:unnamed protein product, partial [Rotaria sp. Silwood2]